MTGIKSQTNLNFGRIWPVILELPALEQWKTNVSGFSHSPLIGFLSKLQVIRTGIKARMNSNLGRIGLFTMELFALARMMVAKNFKLYLYIELTVPKVSDCSPLGRLVHKYYPRCVVSAWSPPMNFFLHLDFSRKTATYKQTYYDIYWHAYRVMQLILQTCSWLKITNTTILVMGINILLK